MRSQPVPRSPHFRQWEQPENIEAIDNGSIDETHIPLRFDFARGIPADLQAFYRWNVRVERGLCFALGIVPHFG